MTQIYRIFFKFTLLFFVLLLNNNLYAKDELKQENTELNTNKTTTNNDKIEEANSSLNVQSQITTPYNKESTPTQETSNQYTNSSNDVAKQEEDKESENRSADYTKKPNNIAIKEKTAEEKAQALKEEEEIDALLKTDKEINPQGKKLSKLVPNKIQSIDLDDINFNQNFNAILEVQLKEGSDILIEGIKNELEEGISGIPSDKKSYLEPIFIVTGITDDITYFYGLEVCKLLNSKKQYLSLNCMVLPVSSVKNAANYLRRGKYSNLHKKLGVSADFIITRSDYLGLHQLKKGPLKNYPDLDLVMFLNGEYIFALSPLQENMNLNLSSIESVINNKDKLNILFMSTDSQIFFEEITQNISKKSINYLFYDDTFKEKYITSKDSEVLCNLKKVDLIVYVGSEFNENMNDLIKNCGKILYPLTFKDSTINELQSNNNEYSTADVSKYYPLSLLLNYSNVMNYKKSLKDDFVISDKNTYNDKNSKLNGEMFNVFLSNVKKDQKSKSKSKKEEKPVQEDFVVGNIAIKTIGIRYVLAATRYTKNNSVIKVMKGFLDDFTIIKGSFPTLDMSTFSLSDIIRGTQVNNPYIYHYAVGNFPKYVNESRVSTEIDKIISKIIYNNKIDSQIPKLFGPEFPNQNQIQVLNNMHILHTKERNLQKQINGIKRIVKDAAYYMDEKNAIQNKTEIEKQLNKRKELKEKNKRINEISKEQ